MTEFDSQRIAYCPYCIDQRVAIRLTVSECPV
jgi:hypothetical protein